MLAGTNSHGNSATMAPSSGARGGSPGGGGGLVRTVPVHQEHGDGQCGQGTQEVTGVAEAVHDRAPAANHLVADERHGAVPDEAPGGGEQNQAQHDCSIERMKMAVYPDEATKLVGLSQASKMGSLRRRVGLVA